MWKSLLNPKEEVNNDIYLQIHNIILRGGKDFGQVEEWEEFFIGVL